MLLSCPKKARGPVYNRGGTADQHLPSPALGLTGEPCTWRTPSEPSRSHFPLPRPRYPTPRPLLHVTSIQHSSPLRSCLFLSFFHSPRQRKVDAYGTRHEVFRGHPSPFCQLQPRPRHRLLPELPSWHLGDQGNSPHLPSHTPSSEHPKG